MISNITIALVNTSHLGNIGATARAMKNMGLYDLRLVNPKDFPSAEASARASGADDVLQQATVFDSLEAALADQEEIYAASARARTLNWQPLTAETACQQMLIHPNKKIAIVFGNERCGLSNDELNLAHHQVIIPTNAAYSSLNLSQAVQVICYELFKQWSHINTDNPTPSNEEPPAASLEQLQNYMNRLEDTLQQIDFLKPPHTMLMKRIRRIYNRAKLDQNEINILQGMLSAVNRAVSTTKQ